MTPPEIPVSVVIPNNGEPDQVRRCLAALEGRLEARVLGAVVSSSCTHSFIGWLKNKTRAQCQLCERICAKYSFQCPDCGSVACMQATVLLDFQC